MRRCLALARLGQGSVAPNPMVGAVLCYGSRIIGEGYHRQYGQPHAEVNCLASVAAEDLPLIPASTLYVSLEPCAHFGKTPPCADLIIRHQIKRVVIGCRDPFPAVDGKGMEKLKAAGIDIVFPVLESACMAINERFFTFHLKQRPYIVLKWAQTSNGITGYRGNERLLISHPFSNRLVHRWRSEAAAILVGTETALLDNPSLTTRQWVGNSPVRVVTDRGLRLPATLALFDGKTPTVVLNLQRDGTHHNLRYVRMEAPGAPQQICSALHGLGLQSVLIEGGTRLLQAFLDEGRFDEIRILTAAGTADETPAAIKAPRLPGLLHVQAEQLQQDRIDYYRPLPGIA